MKKALLVIDMQNVYLEGNIWECINMDNITNCIIDKINEFAKEDIFFTKFIAPSNPIGVWNDYNKEYNDINNNLYLNDYIKELKKYITENNLYLKSTYSSLKNKELYNKLMEYDTIYITGVVADCCILASIYDLIDMGKKIIYCVNGIGSPSKEVNDAVITILKGLSPLHIEFEE